MRTAEQSRALATPLVGGDRDDERIIYRAERPWILALSFNR